MPYNPHNLFLNAEDVEQNLEHKELEESIKRVKDSVDKLENKTSANLTREVESLTNSIARAAETVHQELQTSVSEIEQNVSEVTNQLDTTVTMLTSSMNEVENRVNSRVDNIIANSSSTEGNSELIDIRTGIDGYIYSSASQSVRSQLGDISEKLTRLETDILDNAFSYHVQLSSKWLERGIVSHTTGTFNNTSARIGCCHFIRVNFEDVKYITVNIKTGFTYNISWYSDASEDSFISGMPFSSQNSDIFIPENANYLRFSIAFTDNTSMSTLSLDEAISKIEIQLNITSWKDLGTQFDNNTTFVEWGSEVDDAVKTVTTQFCSPLASTVYVSNRNLYYISDYYNTNNSDFDCNSSTSSNNRIRTNTFGIPSNVGKMVIHGLPENIYTVAVRGYDCFKNLIPEAARISNFDGGAFIELSNHVSYIHILFGTIDGSMTNYSVFDNAQIMLELGDTVHDYISAARYSYGMANNRDYNLRVYQNNQNYNILWSLHGSITFKSEQSKNITKIFDTTKKGLYNKFFDIPSIYHYSYYNLSGTFDDFDINSTAQNVYNKLAAIASGSKGYVTAIDGGADESGTLQQWYYVLDNGCRTLEKPSIYIIANQHGYEKISGIACCYLIDMLTNHFEEHPILQNLHSYYHIVIMPIANPYGFNQYNSSTAGTETGYTNYNNINLNRNWSVGFPSGSSGGSEAFSELETIHMRNIGNNLYNMAFFMDVHGNGSTRDVGINAPEKFNWIALCDNGDKDLDRITKEYIGLISSQMCKKWGLDVQQVGSVTHGTGMNATAKDYFNYYMIPSCTFELPHRIPYTNDGEFSSDTVCSAVEMLVNWLGCVAEMLKNKNK